MLQLVLTNVCISAALTSVPARQLHLYPTYASYSQRHELVGNGQPEEVYIQFKYAEPYPVEGICILHDMIWEPGWTPETCH